MFLRLHLNRKLSSRELFSSNVSWLSIKAHGANGQLPNLDLVNTIVRVAATGVGVPVIDFGDLVPLPSCILSLFEVMLTSTGLAPYMNIQTHTLLTFMLRQATGVPSGNHGAGGKYNVDSLTLSFHGVGKSRLGTAPKYRGDLVLI